MTGDQVLRRALRLIGAIAPGEPITPEEAADSMEVLQAMLDTWRTQSLLCYVIKKPQIPCISNKAYYTIGPGGDFDMPRPVQHPYAVINVDKSNAAQPLDLPAELLNVQQWAQIPVKNIVSRLFTRAYYEPEFPLGRVYVWPIVDNSVVDIKLFLLTAIEGLHDLATEFYFAPGYEEAIVYNLACRLGPEWGEEVPPIVMRDAGEFLANVKRTNIVLDTLIVDPALLFSQYSQYNWKSDQNA